MNPKVQKFLEEHDDIRMLGLAWALYWRFTAVVYGVLLGLGITVGILGAF
jgi:hypothetical protein